MRQKNNYQIDKLHALLDYMPLPMAVFQMPKTPLEDVAHKTRYVNKKFTETMGYEIEDIPNHKIWLQLAIEDSKTRQQVVQQWRDNVLKPVNKPGDYLLNSVEIKCKNNKQRSFKIYTEMRRKIYTGMYIVTFFDQSLELENNSLKKMSISNDQLTNLANKQFMLRTIDDEAARVNRFGDTYSIIVANIDNIQDIEEQYGQDCAEYILKNLAEIFRSNVRKIDLVSRWDNDKFLILIPRTKSDQAYKINQIILEKINDFDFIYKENKCNVILTSGVSEYQIGESVNSTIARADSAIYLAKTRGKAYIIQPENGIGYPKKARFESKM